jgi:Caspase domain
LQDWIAKRIRARKAMLLLDTCESGALVAGHNAVAASTSWPQRPPSAACTRPPAVLCSPAAASGKAAWEGYKGHGVFTWALLDALRNGDTNANGTIELSELVAHVQNLVPELGSLARGWAVVGPATAPPSPPTASRPTAQAARFGSRGEDCRISRRLQ